MDVTQRAEDSIRVLRATSYRARGVVAVEVRLDTEDAEPWTAADAELVGAGGVRLRVLRVWQPEPIRQGKKAHRVVVEAEATEAETRGSFTLQLQEANGRRSVRLDGVTFP